MEQTEIPRIKPLILIINGGPEMWDLHIYLIEKNFKPKFHENPFSGSKDIEWTQNYKQTGRQPGHISIHPFGWKYQYQEVMFS